MSPLQLIQEEAELFSQTGKELEFLRTNYRAIQKRYADEYIAVHGSKVLAHGKSLDDVLQAIRAAKVDVTRVIVEFIPDAKSALVV